MDSLTKDELAKLIDVRRAPCISIYLPTFRAWTNAEQNLTRFKNLVQRSERELAAGGFTEAEARGFLAPARKLLDDGDFWRHPEDGLAVFASPDFFARYRLAQSFPELAVVNDRFHVKPLLPLTAAEGRFWVLALSRKKLRLLECAPSGAVELDPGALSAELGNAFRYIDSEQPVELRPGEPPRLRGARNAPAGRERELLYPEATDDPRRRKNLARSFHRAARALEHFLGDAKGPLVLAGVDELQGLYRDVNRYRHLVPDGISGNPDRIRAEELHRRARPLVQPFFERSQEDVASLYRQLAGTRLASHDLKDVVPAAHLGRVGTLFVALGVERWGRYDPVRRSTDLARDPGAQDLLDLAAVQTIANGGAVFAVPPERMPVPDHSPVAAIFRY